ncbi:MAG TPA: hypothetical protein ENG59_00780 [Chloroflexi bacterium]|nr:MAG: hypothetical protein DRI46_10760 [Chloroflexota bacterium]HDD54760.1 hypothetical protein [Chloroflexota bacterium]
MTKLHLHRGLFLLLLITITACSPGPREYGTLAGQVAIGPLVPVVREGEEESTPAPEVYAAREIVVYKQNGKTEFARLEINSTGWYQGELPVGVYVVDINHLGIDMAKGLPSEVVITAGAVTRVDIDIDTGIR